MKTPLPDREFIQHILHYDPITGIFTWQNRTGKAAHYNGKIAGKKFSGYYSQIMISGKTYYSHIIAWLHYYGEPIPEEIDHIDQNKFNNAIENLRATNRSGNMLNKFYTSSTGIQGVKWYPNRNKFQAAIQKDRKQIHLGYFTTIEEAITARRKAEIELFGFNRHQLPPAD